jgi:hypothetical protein
VVNRYVDSLRYTSTLTNVFNVKILIFGEINGEQISDFFAQITYSRFYGKLVQHIIRVHEYRQFFEENL